MTSAGGIKWSRWSSKEGKGVKCGELGTEMGKKELLKSKKHKNRSRASLPRGRTRSKLGPDDCEGSISGMKGEKLNQSGRGGDTVTRERHWFKK